MKRLFNMLTLGLLLLGTSETFAQCTINYNAWNLVFEDEFTSQSAFEANWDPDNDPNVCATDFIDDAKNYPQNSYISNGFLNIDVNRLAVPDSCPTDSGWLKPVHYSCGWVTSNQTYRYGLFEARCKLAAGGGIESAFWLFFGGQDEIDIFEFDGDRLGKEFSTSTIDWTTGTACSQYWRTNHHLGLSEEFHTYSVAWTSTTITFFFDGQELWTKDANNLRGSLEIILSANANYWANISSSKLLVDYVRVYQQKPQEIPIKGQPYPALNLSTSTYTASNTTAKSVSVGEGYSVFYRDNNNWLAGLYPDQSGWHPFYPTSSWNIAEKVGGDVVVITEENKDQIYYRGTNGELRAYLYENGSWVAYLLYSPTNTNYRISAQPGSLAVGRGNDVYYRGGDDYVHRLTRNPLTGIWEHSYLVANLFKTGEKVAGDLVIGVWNSPFYRGVDGKIHNYYYSNGWQHRTVGQYASSNNYVSTAAGSIVIGDRFQFESVQGVPIYNVERNRIFYRGEDNLIQSFSPQGDGGAATWTHSYLSPGSSPPVATGNLAVRGKQIFYMGSGGQIMKYDWNLSTQQWGHQGTGTYGANNLVVDCNNALYYNGTDGYVHQSYWRTCENYNNVCNTFNVNLLNKISKKATAVNPVSKDEMNITPNPNNGNFVIDLNTLNAENAEIFIINSQGVEVFRQTMQKGVSSIDISHLPNGPYILRLTDKDAHRTVKFIKN